MPASSVDIPDRPEAPIYQRSHRAHAQRPVECIGYTTSLHYANPGGHYVHGRLGVSNGVETETTLIPITPTPLPTCIQRQGETGLQDSEYDYLGWGRWHNRVNNNYLPRVKFTNPHGRWEYGIRIRWSGALRVEMVVRSDDMWQIRFGQHDANTTVASGTLDVDSRDGGR